MSVQDALLRSGCSVGGTPGQLTVTHDLMIWVPDQPHAREPLRVPVSAITSKQTAKGKPFMRILATGLVEPAVLQFESPQHRDQAVEMLNAVAASLPQAAAAAPASHAPSSSPAPSGPEADARRRVLDSNPSIRGLYESLVGGKVLTEGEFWGGGEVRKAVQDELKGGAGKQQVQHVGIATAMYERQLGTAQKIKMTPEIIMQIVAENPAVQRALVAYVPGHLKGEALRQKHMEFWVKYVNYLKAKGQGGDAVRDDEHQLFVQCEREADRTQRDLNRARARRVDPTVDLISDRNDGLSQGYGFVSDKPQPAQPDRPELGGARGGRAIIRELNRHAAAVVDGLPEPVKTGGAAGGTAEFDSSVVSIAAALERVNVAAAEESRRGPSGPSLDPLEYDRIKRREGASLDDLKGPRGEAPRVLPVRNVRNYFKGGAAAGPGAGPGPGAGAGTGTAGAGGEKYVFEFASTRPAMSRRGLLDALTSMRVAGVEEGQGATGLNGLEDMDVDLEGAEGAEGGWGGFQLESPVLRPDLALRVLEDSAGARVQELSTTPAAVQALLLQRGPVKAVEEAAAVVEEALRHFYGCFPLSSDQKRDKARRLQHAISQQYDRLQVLQDAARGADRQQLSALMRPMLAVMDAALQRYDKAVKGRG